MSSTGPAARTIVCGAYALIWTAVLVFLGHDAVLHPYSRAQRGDADGRLVAAMVVYVVACIGWTWWIAGEVAARSKSSNWIVGSSIIQFAGYLVVTFLLNGFPFY